MRILIFSDIHGSLPVARHIRELAASMQPDYVMLLGDILYHGPRNPLPQGYDPQAAAAELASLGNNVIAMKGNCDNEADESLLPFPLTPGSMWLFVEGLRIHATHGHTFTLETLPALPEETILLYGHTHVPMARMVKGLTLCNPGSLCLPKEGHPASYGLLEHGSFSVITREGEVYLRLDCL